MFFTTPAFFPRISPRLFSKIREVLVIDQQSAASRLDTFLPEPALPFPDFSFSLAWHTALPLYFSYLLVIIRP